MAKNLVDKAFEEYIEQIIQPENLQKRYETELQLRGKYEMVEVTSLKEFEQKTRMKLHTKDRHKICCDVLQVIRPVCEGWKAMDTIRKEIEEKAKEKKQAGKKAMVEAESTESSFSEAPETSKGKKRKRPSPSDPEGKHSDTANKDEKKKKEEAGRPYRKSILLMAEEYVRRAEAKGKQEQLNRVFLLANRFDPIFAKRLHKCDMRPISEMALPDPDNKIACQEPAECRSISAKGNGQGKCRKAILTSWKLAEKESYKKLRQDMRDGIYTHNPFDYMVPEKYLQYETMGQEKDNGKKFLKEERGWDYNKPPPKEKDPNSLLSHFEEEYERLKQRTPSSSTPNADGPGTSALQPTLPSLLLTDPPYFGPDTLSPKIEERPSYAAAAPTEILPRPRTMVIASKPTDSMIFASS
ncbi:hypothetical protein FA10DRAFT_260333 [Acaromyces ingoldii]|uniref:Uncharacterized protein n=1 Tax=Acaromyces ingoldii TaxID=215250 RepID=A0A316YMY0_9BASI|nr:hypothetical protein FA10DRAFT_260333 [Acaromyces ingoldii]PWN90512.1 hypothetical protein FA10DRAFT_260333 [Acaromyces ingoldii]